MEDSKMRMGAVISFALYLAVVVGTVVYYMDQADRYQTAHSENRPGCFRGICNPALQNNQKQP
ncbi:MAG: hypothetical protein Q7S28_02730 [bacterium]|nr:hypothetical protein [bacterium]